MSPPPHPPGHHHHPKLNEYVTGGITVFPAFILDFNFTLPIFSIRYTPSSSYQSFCFYLIILSKPFKLQNYIPIFYHSAPELFDIILKSDPVSYSQTG